MGVIIDPRNAKVLNWLDGRFVARDEPALPLFDSGFLHGKQVWSAPRLIAGRLFRLQDHLDKIRHSAELNYWPRIPGDAEIVAAIRQTLQRNNMHDGVHVRIMLTAGTQITASMDMAAVTDEFGVPSPPRIIVAPEYRDAVYDAQGIAAITSSLKRPGPDMVDQRSHDNNQNASSRACIEAKRADVTTALMYDAQGYLAEAFASHAAIVKDGVLLTPYVRACPDGVTRKVIFELCAANDIEAVEADITQAQVSAADELMILGTMSGPVPVTLVDGEVIGSGDIGPVTARLAKLYGQAQHDPAQGTPMDDSQLYSGGNPTTVGG